MTLCASLRPSFAFHRTAEVLQDRKYAAACYRFRVRESQLLISRPKHSLTAGYAALSGLLPINARVAILTSSRLLVHMALIQHTRTR